MNKQIKVEDTFDNSDKSLRGKVIVRDKETNEVLMEKDNLVLMSTRVWLAWQLFKTPLPSNYKPKYPMSTDRQIVLLSVGSGGADVNASAFSPYVPLFSDKDLKQKVPYIIVDPDKDNDASQKANPSIVTKLTDAQKKMYYMPVENPDGSVYYYAKRPEAATDKSPYGTSKGWNIDENTGEVSFSTTFTIDKNECRGTLINEIGLWLGKFNSASNTYEQLELATRITFDTEPFSSLTKEVEIEYVVYVL